MVTVYIDPWSVDLLNDGLFDNTPRLGNRDEVLSPWAYLQRVCMNEGISLRTADFIPEREQTLKSIIYYAFGQVLGYQRYASRKDIVLGSMYLFEPPIGVISHEHDPYYHIPELASLFRRVYTTSPVKAIEQCYRILIPASTKIFHYPQPYDKVIEPYWSQKNRKFLVMINSCNSSPLYGREYYSKRIKALSYFSKFDSIDLYGYRWDSIITRKPMEWCRMYLSAIKHGNLSRLRALTIFLSAKNALKKCLCSPCENMKYSTLANYQYALCFESMGIESFISEKIFDCLMAGTVPIYLGAPNIESYVPQECFINFRRIGSFKKLLQLLNSQSDEDREIYRRAGKDFFGSDKFSPFTKESFAKQFISDVKSDMSLIS